MTKQMMRSTNLSKVVRARSVYHRYIFYPMGMGKRRQIGHVGTFGHYIANDEDKNPLRGGQDWVGGP